MALSLETRDKKNNTPVSFTTHNNGAASKIDTRDSDTGAPGGIQTGVWALSF